MNNSTNIPPVAKPAGQHHYRAFTGTHRVAITLPNGARLTRELVTASLVGGVSELAVKL